MTLNNKQVLIAGGAGFLGSHMSARLLNEGHFVYCLDNLSTGQKKNIEALWDHPQFHFLEHDVVEPLDENIFVDEIYNFACPASPLHYQKDPIHTIKSNVFGAYNLLELARKCEAKIFQASTSEVYGDPLMHPQNENYLGNVNPCGKRACYNEAKRCAETFFFDYQRTYGVKIKVARIFNTYGPHMHENDGRVISNLIINALKNEPLLIYGDGLQTRSFCYVTDLLESISLLMDTPDEFLGPVNLGNDDEYTILDLAKKILELTASRSPVQFTSSLSDDPKKRRPCLDFAKNILGYRPLIGIEEGLKRTIAYFEAALSLPLQA